MHTTSLIKTDIWHYELHSNGMLTGTRYKETVHRADDVRYYGQYSTPLGALQRLIELIPYAEGRVLSPAIEAIASHYKVTI